MGARVLRRRIRADPQPPGWPGWTRRRTTLQVAASIALLALVFGAGWVGHGLQEQMVESQAALESIVPSTRHVILHIGESDEVRFTALLKKAEDILEKYSAQGVEVEVITNGGGLDLVRTAASRHVDSIRKMISQYHNVHFIACSKGLERLRKLGQDSSVIDGVYNDEPAADHLIQRLTEGWTLIRI